MILLLDNYDSFTFNVAQALQVAAKRCDESVRVVRNDQLTPEQLLALEPTAIVLSPGPGEPRDAGHMPALLAQTPADLPLLGICLGHQALIEHFGGSIVRDPEPVHGRASQVLHAHDPLFANVPSPFDAARYHSLRAAEPLPGVLRKIAWLHDGMTMAVRHESRPWVGVQFHPESFLSPHGTRIVENFLAQIPREAASN